MEHSEKGACRMTMFCNERLRALDSIPKDFKYLFAYSPFITPAQSFLQAMSLSATRPNGITMSAISDWCHKPRLHSTSQKPSGTWGSNNQQTK
mmetsp:Transcript_101147/g.182562  ORF Transcript_101147/g.182562 Transcript_101147/m.182562 type:complete len:93 (-) Transcript_101147:36-314(-)